MTMADQQTAPPAQQTAPVTPQTAAPRFNYRIAGGFEGYQAENIEVLRKKMGTSDTGVLRVAIDLLSFCNGLEVRTDPEIFLINYLARTNNLTHQDGDR
jgi:hypothetical protein